MSMSNMSMSNKSNLSFIDRIISYERYLALYVKFFNIYRKNYKNYISVIRQVLGKKYPITAVNHNGTKKVFLNYIDLYNDVMQIRCESKEDLVYVNNLVFYGGKTNGDIVGVFNDEEYSDLPVKDRVVLDIGANIGDSAIYFAAQGAERVLAIEPDEMCYKFAQKNIEANGLSEVVKIIRGAVVSSDSNIKENSSMKLLTLQDIIRNYDLESTILKMDCEGCEYDVILNTPPGVLRNFTHLKVEYHYGYRNLMNKLRNSGFITKPTRPRYFKPALNPNSLNVYFAGGQCERINSVYVGWLAATRQ